MAGDLGRTCPATAEDLGNGDLEGRLRSMGGALLLVSHGLPLHRSGWLPEHTRRGADGNRPRRKRPQPPLSSGAEVVWPGEVAAVKAQLSPPRPATPLIRGRIAGDRFLCFFPSGPGAKDGTKVFHASTLSHPMKALPNQPTFRGG